MELGTIIHAIIALIFVLGFAYLIWAAAAKSEGQIQSVGNILAIAVAAAGILVIVGMATAPMFGGRPFGMDMHGGASTAAAPSSSSTTAPDSSSDTTAAPSDSSEKPGSKP